MKVPSLTLVALAILPLVLTSCGSFEKRWQESVAAYQAGEVDSPEGPWIGSWTTKTNGHTGDLRAIVSENANGEYDFKYHATWGKIFSGGYRVTYPATRSGSTYKVDGEQNMGLFGTFRHRATISGNRFDATYSNDKGDLGEFSMKRP